MRHRLQWFIHPRGRGLSKLDEPTLLIPYLITDANVCISTLLLQLGPTDGKSVIAGYADIRWHQTADIGYTPNNFMQNVFMAVAFDLTDKVYDSLHHFRCVSQFINLILELDTSPHFFYKFGHKHRLIE